MKVIIERTDTMQELKFNGKASDLLNLLAVNSEEVLVVVNNELVSLEHKIKDQDKVEILSIISGG